MPILTKHCRKFKHSTFLFFLITSIFASSARTETTPKYVPGVESIAYSHQYIQKNEALLYWQISPYYLSQLTDSSCSLATATMIVNAVRSGKKLTADQPLATQNDLLHRVNNTDWIKDVRQGGDVYLEVSIELFTSILTNVFFTPLLAHVLDLVNDALQTCVGCWEDSDGLRLKAAMTDWGRICTSLSEASRK